MPQSSSFTYFNFSSHVFTLSLASEALQIEQGGNKNNRYTLKERSALSEARRRFERKNFGGGYGRGLTAVAFLLARCYHNGRLRSPVHLFFRSNFKTAQC